MENIVPKCINNNACSNVCNVNVCKANPFLCGDRQCQCHSQHKQCNSTSNWKSIIQKFTNKLKQSLSYMDEYFTQVNDIYKNVLKQIDKSFQQIKSLADNFGLNQLERQVYQKLKQSKFGELTGEMINKVEIELMTNKKQFQVWIIENEKKQIEKQTTILIQMLEGLSKLNVVKWEYIKQNSPIKQTSIQPFKLDSKITQDVETLLSFFTKKIVSMNLLYRASENAFYVGQFHEKCDNKPHTITILKTKFGNVIGGYTPLAWDRYKQYINNGRQIDNSMQSFLFSLTNKHKLTLLQGQQKYAIYQSFSQGPIFGGGADLYIGYYANQNKSSYGRPGYSYNYNNEYDSNNQQSYKKWSGQSNGYSFGIQQWQVFQIVFG